MSHRYELSTWLSPNVNKQTNQNKLVADINLVNEKLIICKPSVFYRFWIPFLNFRMDCIGVQYFFSIDFGIKSILLLKNYSCYFQNFNFWTYSVIFSILSTKRGALNISKARKSYITRIFIVLIFLSLKNSLYNLPKLFVK